MLTYLVDDNNNIKRTVNQVIMQKSNLINNIHILAPRYYQGIDMAEFSCTMEYILPSKQASRVYDITPLSINNTNYNNENYLEYLIAGDTTLTSEAGDIEFQLTWVKVGDANGLVSQYVRKTIANVITITPITVWSDIMPDENLTALDQRLVKMEALAKQYAEFQNTLSAKLVTDIKLDSDTRKLQLKTDLEDIGEGVKVSDLSDMVAEDIVGVDADGNPDGVINLNIAQEKNS